MSGFCSLRRDLFSHNDWRSIHCPLHNWAQIKCLRAANNTPPQISPWHWSSWWPSPPLPGSRSNGSGHHDSPLCDPWRSGNGSWVSAWAHQSGHQLWGRAHLQTGPCSSVASQSCAWHIAAWKAGLGTVEPTHGISLHAESQWNFID